MRRLSRLGWLLLLAWLAIQVAACHSDEDAWPRIEASGILRIGLDPTFPPFEMADDGELRGLDVDLARALADELGLTAGFVYFGYDGLYDALATDQVDVLISALVIMPERWRDFAYSAPYFDAGQVLVTGVQAAGVSGLADLDGRSLAVEIGSEGHVIATTWARRLPELIVQTYDSPDAALTAVANEAAGAAVVDAVSARLFLAAHDGLRIAPEPIALEPYAVVVRIEDQMLLARLDEGLDRLRTSGQLEAIIARWLDRPTEEDGDS